MTTITIAEQIMSRAYGGAVRLEAVDDLGGSDRSTVRRLQVLGGSDGAPASVIVKRAMAGDGERYDPDASDGPAWRLFNEWAGLELLGEVMGTASPAPHIIGGDRTEGIIVLEDVGSAPRLDHILLGSDPAAAEATLLALAAALGGMHAATIGHAARYQRIRNTLGPRLTGRFSDPYERRNYARLGEGLHAAIAALEIMPPADIDSDLESLRDHLAAPGPFLALTHRDACPDNILLTEGGIRLLDFEFAGYGHALIDGVYGRMHFPSCWCVNRLPDDVPARMEERYRGALIAACPEASDDTTFYRAVVDASAAHILSRHDIPTLLRADADWGIATRRQRTLLRFGLFARLTEEFGHLRALGAAVSAMAEILRARWTPDLAPMPLYPAFR